MRQAQQLNCHFLWWSWQNTYTHTYLTLLPSTTCTYYLASSNLVGDHNILELIYHLHWTQNRSNESHASCPVLLLLAQCVCENDLDLWQAISSELKNSRWAAPQEKVALTFSIEDHIVVEFLNCLLFCAVRFCCQLDEWGDNWNKFSNWVKRLS